jgi:hypothetical protein
VNFNKIFAIACLGVLAALNAGCSGAGPTPTRTPRAQADNSIATQTPWFIYVPVTTTPEPSTVTPLPTVTSSVPTPKPTNTRAPRPAAPAATRTPVPPTDVPTTPTPAPSPTPSCGQAYQVLNLILPENGNTKSIPQNPGGNAAIIFRFTPANGITYQLDPQIGYQVYIQAPPNHGAVRYMSHNAYVAKFTSTQGDGMVLDPHAVAALAGGGSTNATWNVTVVRSSSGFDDNTEQALGTVTPCGPPSPSYTILISVF